MSAPVIGVREYRNGERNPFLEESGSVHEARCGECGERVLLRAADVREVGRRGAPVSCLECSTSEANARSGIALADAVAVLSWLRQRYAAPDWVLRALATNARRTGSGTVRCEIGPGVPFIITERATGQAVHVMQKDTFRVEIDETWI